MKIVYNYAVLTNFERFGSAANDRGMKPVLAGILCSVRQKSPIKFRLAGQFNRMPPNLAFFVCVALPALSVGTSQPPERTDERTLLDVGTARRVAHQGTRKAQVNEVNFALLGAN